MPKIRTGDIETYYEIKGGGFPLVFIHGGWVSCRMWAPQVEYFSDKYKVITYDVRGHGRTGASSLKKYSFNVFADDLFALLQSLEISRPVICGLSMGGMIAQTYAVKYPDNFSALVLADTAISTALTFSDKLTKYVLGPKWLFTSLVRLMGVKRYADFAFWYAARSRSSGWVGDDRSVSDYEKEEMIQIPLNEFNKIFSALYDFELLNLSSIRQKVLVMNGEFESKAVFKHTEKMKELIPDITSVVIPGAGHTSNMQNPQAFNLSLEEFLKLTGIA